MPRLRKPVPYVFSRIVGLGPGMGCVSHVAANRQRQDERCSNQQQSLLHHHRVLHVSFTSPFCSFVLEQYLRYMLNPGHRKIIGRTVEPAINRTVEWEGSTL